MSVYDSSFETSKHINRVSKYIDVICERLSKTYDFNEDIKESTLIDVLLLISHGIDIQTTDVSIKSIELNSICPVQFNDYEKYKAFIIKSLQRRKKTHDLSKLHEPEKSGFDIWTPKLADSMYGSDEYYGFLFNLKEELNHHYKNNRHHPEHFKKGIFDMSIIDIIEMFSDWKASSERYNKCDLFNSFDINQRRFKYGNVLNKVFKNTNMKCF